jgi:HEAT repeat protein
MTLQTITSILWNADKILMISAFFLSVFTMFYYFMKETLNRRRNIALLNVKKNVHALAEVSRQASCGTVHVKKISQFLDIEMNREAILFSSEERGFIKDYFVQTGNIDRLIKTAGGSLDKWRRIEAILSLGYAGSELALPVLQKGLEDKDDDISYFSLSSLAMIPTKASAKVIIGTLNIYPSMAQSIASVLEKFPPEINDEIIVLAESDTVKIRYWALRLISVRNIKEGFQIAFKLLYDPSPDVRAAACECVGRIGDNSAKDALLDRLEDSAWFVRMAAVRSLARILKSDSLQYVVPCLSDPAFLVKESVKSTIIGNIDAAIPYIAKILDSDDTLSKQQVIEAVEASGYLKRILDEVAYGAGQERQGALSLLDKMLKASVRFGVGSASEKYPRTARKKLLDAIHDIDKDLARRIEDNWIRRGIAYE